MASGPTIIAKFLSDTTKLTEGVDKASKGAGASISSFAKGAAVAIGGAFAVDQIVKFGTESVKAAAADAEAQEKLATTLRNVTGATDDQIASTEDFIGKLSKQTAIADDDLRPAMDNLVRGFGDAEEAQKALSLATDISAGTGKDLGTVSEMLMKAANGQTGALKKLGVETTNADGSAKSLDEIMGDLSSTFKGQASAAAETTAGKMRNAQIQFGEFQETIGAALLPVLATLASFFMDTLIPALDSVASWIGGHMDIIVAAFIGLGVVVGAVVIPAFIAWAVAAGAAALATIAAAAPFIAIGAVIAAVAFLIIHNWDTIVDATTKAWDAVVDAVKFVWQWIKDNWPLLLAVITGPIGVAVLLVQRNWDTIKEGATDVWQWIKDKWQAISDAIGGVVDTIGGYIDTIVTNIKKPIAAATEVYDWIKEKFEGFADLIENVIGGVDTAVGKVVDAITGPINAVLGMWNGLQFKIPTFTLPEFDTHIPGVGKVGGGTVGGQTIDFPNIPLLASGAVLTSPTLFIGGEAGTEIVAPEDLLRAIVAEEGGGHYELNIYPRTADASDIAYGFRRLELMAGLP